MLCSVFHVEFQNDFIYVLCFAGLFVRGSRFYGLVALFTLCFGSNCVSMLQNPLGLRKGL